MNIDIVCEKNPEFKEYYQKILYNARYVGIKPYSHNIVGMLLNAVAEKYSHKFSNLIIVEAELESLGWKQYQDPEEL